MRGGPQAVCAAVWKAFCKLRSTSVSGTVVNTPTDAFLFLSVSTDV